MIAVRYGGREVLFDDEGVDRTKPPHVYSFLLKNEFYEMTFLDYIHSLGVEGVYVDAGAFIGTHTLFFSIICEAEHVYAFEPRESIAKKLEKNVSLNGCAERVTVRALGLSERAEIVTVTMMDRQFTFETGPLDSLVAAPVSLIKIDVEGMEDRVLRGARRILREDRPIVFAELASKEEYDIVCALMRTMNYEPTGRVFNATPTYEFWPT
jgi:FkbM family methyltransferase